MKTFYSVKSKGSMVFFGTYWQMAYKYQQTYGGKVVSKKSTLSTVEG